MQNTTLDKHRNKLINGRYTGCADCVGYCRCRQHEGFLNEKLRAEHGCLGKNCTHYEEIRKPPKRPKAPQNEKLVLTYANELLAQTEGVKAHNVEKVREVYIIHYVTVTNAVCFENTVRAIAARFGSPVRFERSNYDYDVCAHMIFG